MKPYFLFYFVILALTFFTVGCNIIADDGWEKGGVILFVARDNPNKIIVEQEYLSGAWDTETTKRTVIRDLLNSTTSSIDTSTIDKTKWIKLNVVIRDWDDRGFHLYDGELQSLKTINDTLFKHKNLTEYKKVILPLKEYHKLSGSKYCYGNRDCSDDFKVFVFYSGGGILLQVTDNKFNNIDFIELMRKKVGFDYYYHKMTIFKSKSEFTLIKKYKSFNKLTDGSVDMDSFSEITFSTDYKISSKGEIIKISNKDFGSIELSAPLDL